MASRRQRGMKRGEISKEQWSLGYRGRVRIFMIFLYLLGASHGFASVSQPAKENQVRKVKLHLTAFRAGIATACTESSLAPQVVLSVTLCASVPQPKPQSWVYPRLHSLLPLLWGSHTAKHIGDTEFHSRPACSWFLNMTSWSHCSLVLPLTPILLMTPSNSPSRSSQFWLLPLHPSLLSTDSLC